MKGIRSVSVPGIADGWLKAHERYGALKLEQAFEPSNFALRERFPISHNLAGGSEAKSPLRPRPIHTPHIYQ